MNNARNLLKFNETTRQEKTLTYEPNPSLKHSSTILLTELPNKMIKESAI